jgi:hypothetical protein
MVENFHPTKNAVYPSFQLNTLKCIEIYMYIYIYIYIYEIPDENE